MGGFYGSVQVRSGDRARVKAVAEEVARGTGTHILVGPARGGWVGLYPEGSGQDAGVGQQIAERLGSEVLHLMVHDDSVFAYWLYRDGALVDSFWSLPGYFGEEDRAAQEKMSGNAEAFRPILGDKVKRLAPLLARGEDTPTFASEQLAGFAKVLGISNAVTAYEYLKGGEREGIKGWREFEEVPGEKVEEEVKEKRRGRQQIKSEWRRLQVDGLLLSFEERKNQSPRAFATNGGFLVTWSDHTGTPPTFELYAEPWDKPQMVMLPTTIGMAKDIAGNAAGKRIAMAADHRIQVWDADDTGWSHVLDIHESDVVIGLAITADGKRVAHTSRQEIVMTEITSGERLIACPMNDSQSNLAIHPSGDWVAVLGNTFGLIALGKQPSWRDLYMGGKRDQGPSIASEISRLESEVAAPADETYKIIRQQMKKMGARFKSLMSDEEFDKMQNEWEKEREEKKVRLARLKEGRIKPKPRAQEHVRSIGFSRNGQMFWCGTSVGLRVYDWSKVPREAGADMPTPVWSFDLPPEDEVDNHKYIYSIAEEIDGRGIVFSSLGGPVYRLDLSTGEVRRLVKPPGNIMYTRLVMSLDGNALWAVGWDIPKPEPSPPDQWCRWDIWDYRRLREAGVGV